MLAWQRSTLDFDDFAETLEGGVCTLFSFLFTSDVNGSDIMQGRIVHI